MQPSSVTQSSSNLSSKLLRANQFTAVIYVAQIGNHFNPSGQAINKKTFWRTILSVASVAIVTLAVHNYGTQINQWTHAQEVCCHVERGNRTGTAPIFWPGVRP